MPTVTNSPTPPIAPADGDLWFNTTSGREFVWYIGASGAQWVQTQPSGSMIPTPHADPRTLPSPPTGTPYDVTRTPTITISPVAPTTPLVGDLWWSPITGQQNVWYDDGNTVQWVIANWGAGKPGPPGPPGGVSVVHEGADITITGTSVDPIIGVTPGAFLRSADLTPYATIAYVDAADALLAPLDSPALTGTPTAPTAITGGNTNQQIANVASVINLLNTVLPSYAPLSGPVFTGDPRAPTPATADNDTSIATTAFVRSAISTYSPPPDLSGYAPLASPTFTGDPRAPTPAPTDNDTSIATTAFVQTVFGAAAGTFAPINSPTLTGDPKAPTPATGDNDTSIATTAFVKAQGYATTTYVDAADALKAPLASPTFTGDPKAPTPALGDNDTSIATTAFVAAAIAANPGGAVVGTTPPVSPSANQLWWKSDDGVLLIYYNDGNTTQWVPAAPSAATASPFPPGYVGEFAGTVVPDGWYEMDGSMKTTAGDPALFAAIGYTYGGSGANFAVPDARGRATIGHDPGGTAGRVTNAVSGIHGETVGATGGDQNLYAHGHGSGGLTGAGWVGNNLANGTNRAVGTGDGVNSGLFQQVLISGSTAATGAGNSQNMPPVIVFKKMIKR